MSSKGSLLSPFTVPDSWQLATLKSICTKIGSGATPTGGQAVYQTVRSNFALIRSQNVFDREFSELGLAFISDAQATALKSVEIQPGDILLNITGDGVTFGRACLAPNRILPACVNQHVSIIRLDRKLAHPGYVVSYLTHPEIKKYIESFNAGGSRRAITKGHIESFVVPLPPLGDQHAIAHLLGSLDDRIALLRETNATLEAIAQALFKSWFVDFDPMGAKVWNFDSSVLSPVTDRCRQQRPIPSDWSWSKLGDVSSVSIGKTPPRKEPHWFSNKSSDVPWASIRDMGEAQVFLGATAELLTQSAVKKFNVKVVPENTAIMSFKLTVGRVAVTSQPMATNEAIAHFLLDTSSPVTTEFIYLYLRQFDFSQLSSTSSIAEAVNSKTVRQIPIVVPDKPTLDEFQAIAAPLLRAIRENGERAGTLAALRDTLLPRLISGKLRLPDAESKVAAA